MKILSAAVVVFLLCVASPKPAEARGLAIINTGEDVMHVADIKSEFLAEAEEAYGSGVAVGLIYSRFGLFWLDIWRWDAKYVLFRDDTVWEEDEALLKEIADGGLSKPLTMTLPPGLIVLILAGVGFGIMAWLGRKDEEFEPASGYAEGEYQQPQDPSQHAEDYVPPQAQFNPQDGQQPRPGGHDPNQQG